MRVSNICKEKEKMFCRNCGKEISDKAAICIHCGCKSVIELEPESKKGLGVICGIFLGLIGLLIGICAYREGSLERTTFMGGWLPSFIITASCSILLPIIILISAGSCAGVM